MILNTPGHHGGGSTIPWENVSTADSSKLLRVSGDKYNLVLEETLWETEQGLRLDLESLHTAGVRGDGLN